METKTSKIVNVTANGSFNSKHGTMYKWEVAFENGDYGDANTKTQTQTTWVIGQTVNYTSTPNGNFNPKLAIVKENPVSNHPTVKNEGVQRMIIAQNSITNAVNFHSGNNPLELADVLATADKFFEWVIKKGESNGSN